MLNTIWSNTRRRLRHLLSDDDYETWIAPLRPARWRNAQLTLEAPSTFTQGWVSRNLLAEVERAVTEASGEKASVVVIVNRSLDRPTRLTAVPDRKLAAARGALPPRYTFDTFVVGASNQVAFAAAQAVVARPGERFNPLFLYGDSGLGKTHLVNAVAHAAVANGRAGAVVCLSAENFLNELVVAINGKDTPRFRRRFRDVDVLVLDDIQFLDGKHRSMEEFKHTFNTLYDGRKQIVIASDRPPHALPGFAKALQNRLVSGLIACIDPPDPALRLALVRRKAAERGLTLHTDVIQYLANEWCDNGREIEGALVRLELFSTISARAIDVGCVQEALGPSPAARKHGPTVQRVIREVCDEYDLTEAELASPRRTARLALPRQIAMFLSREQTEVPLRTIGQELGGRDHSTVLHALTAIQRRLQRDAALRERMSRLRSRLAQ